MAEKISKGEESLKGPTSVWKRGKYRKAAEKEYSQAVSMLHLGRTPKSVIKKISSPSYKESQIRQSQRALKERSIYASGKRSRKKISSKR